MTHVSSQSIDVKIREKLFKQLSGLCAGASKKKSEELLASILTPTEQLMLSKRLAAVIMLHERHTQYAVENTLQLSSSTVARIRAGYEKGDYDSICAAFSKRKQEREDFWNTIEVLARLGMPSMVGDRWKFLRGR
jgi:uncharacterized protein YerC